MVNMLIINIEIVMFSFITSMLPDINIDTSFLEESDVNYSLFTIEYHIIKKLQINRHTYN
jgi:hypothetical protein